MHRVEDALLQNMDDEGNCRIQPVDFPWLRSLRLLAPVDQDVTSDDEDSSWMSAHRRVVRLIHAEEQVEQRRSRRRWQSSSRRNCDSSSETDSEAEDWRTCTVHFPALTKLVLAAANRLAGSKRWSPGIGLEVRGWESALSVLASVETGRRALVVD